MLDWSLWLMLGKRSGEAPITVRGAEQNNLKNIDVTIPDNQLTVITGVSGSGKSSLAFDTLYAEGQRRYVESLSAYARQFFGETPEAPGQRDYRDPPGCLHSPEKCHPAIPARQSVRSQRSTTTCDFSMLALGGFTAAPASARFRRDTADHVVEELLGLPEGTRLTLVFPYQLSRMDLNSYSEKGLSAPALVENLVRHGYHRLLLDPQEPAKILHLPGHQPLSEGQLKRSRILIDRLVVHDDAADRLADSIESCLAEGNGVVEALIASKSGSPEILHFSEHLECQYCQISYRELEPRLFSFNNPYGACPTCQGFGNTISIDPDLVIPDWSVPVYEGPVEPFTKPKYKGFQRHLVDFIRDQGIDPATCYVDLPDAVRTRVWEGTDSFPGVQGFFRYLERKKYKMHVRILISRYRGYTRCPDCSGERLCQDARDVTVGAHRITQLTALPIARLRDFLRNLELTPEQKAVARELYEEISRRVGFLVKVGLEYLALDRLTSTLSGGEMQRIHLAASLGSALIGTLYVLDEPTVGPASTGWAETDPHSPPSQRSWQHSGGCGT